jgi:lactoylglutathione lyase
MGILQSVAAVRIFTHNLEQARQFYAEKLELEELAASSDYVTFELAGFDIVIEWIAQDDPDAEYLVGRFVAVSFHVDDVVTAYRQFGERGVTLVEAPQKQPWGGTLAFISDPDGNILTLVQYPAENTSPQITPGKVAY